MNAIFAPAGNGCGGCGAAAGAGAGAGVCGAGAPGSGGTGFGCAGLGCAGAPCARGGCAIAGAAPSAINDRPIDAARTETLITLNPFVLVQNQRLAGTPCTQQSLAGKSLILH